MHIKELWQKEWKKDFEAEFNYFLDWIDSVKCNVVLNPIYVSKLEFSDQSYHKIFDATTIRIINVYINVWYSIFGWKCLFYTVMHFRHKMRFS